MEFIENFKKIFSQPTEKVPTPEDYESGRVYNYESEQSRVATAEWLFSQAKNERMDREAEWKTMDAYYRFDHDVAKEMAETTTDMELPFIPAGIPDPFIMVESQITPDVPMPEFHGRDSDLDSMFAEERQKAVKYVIEANRLNDMNTANERRLRKYGDAFWKAYWDENMMCGEYKGDIRVKDIPIEDIYPDPTAKKLEDCEYIDYVYSMHKFKFWRMYHRELTDKGYTLDNVMMQQYRPSDPILDRKKTAQSRNDLVQVLEHWYRQPFDGDGYEAGDVACTIQAGGIEIKYIPKYWENTGVQNKNFPFVHYWCIHDETSFYNTSEIEPILGLIDTADRELAMGVLNDMMMANDIIIEEENALVPGEVITNVPGSKVKVKQGKMGAVARLGGISNGINSMDTVDWILNQIQRTNRNFDTNHGDESTKVTTASGLLQLRSDAAVQGELKKADRNKGFCRLYELIDWLCLEFYTDDRLLYIGADNPNDPTQQPTTVRYNPEFFAVQTEAKFDQLGQMITPPTVYYPRVDVTVTTGDGIGKNPASTLQVLDRLAAVQVSQDNYKLLEAELDLLDIPQKQMICDLWDKKFESGVTPEVIEALGQNPELLSFVQQTIGMVPGQQTQMPTQGTAMGVEALTDSTAMPDVPTY